jgi:hypothetical protein
VSFGEGQSPSWLWLEDDLSIPWRTRRNARHDLIEPVADSEVDPILGGTRMWTSSRERYVKT